MPERFQIAILILNIFSLGFIMAYLAILFEKVKI